MQGVNQVGAIDGIWLDMNEIINYCSGDVCIDPGVLALAPQTCSLPVCLVLRSYMTATASHPFVDDVLDANAAMQEMCGQRTTFSAICRANGVQMHSWIRSRVPERMCRLASLTPPSASTMRTPR